MTKLSQPQREPGFSTVPTALLEALPFGIPIVGVVTNDAADAIARRARTLLLLERAGGPA